MGRCSGGQMAVARAGVASVGRSVVSSEIWPFHLTTKLNRQPLAKMCPEEEQLKKALLSSKPHPDDSDANSAVIWSYCYQIESLKDDLMELQEGHHRIQRSLKEKTRLHDQLNRDYKRLEGEHRMLQEMLAQRERLIEEHGLVLVNLSAEDDLNDETSSVAGSVSESRKTTSSSLRNGLAGPGGGIDTRPSSTNEYLSLSKLFVGPTLISKDIMELLESFEGSNLEEKLKCMAEEREDLIREVKRLKIDLEEERQQNERRDRMSSVAPSEVSVAAGVNGDASLQSNVIDPDIKKMLHEYKFQLKRAEQEITLLQGNNSRLETQVNRLKSQVEELERCEEELKSEKRRILRELREFQTKSEELETSNQHLQKRIHKLQENRMAIFNATGQMPDREKSSHATSNGPSLNSN